MSKKKYFVVKKYKKPREFYFSWYVFTTHNSLMILTNMLTGRDEAQLSYSGESHAGVQGFVFEEDALEYALTPLFKERQDGYTPEPVDPEIFEKLRAVASAVPASTQPPRASAKTPNPSRATTPALHTPQAIPSQNPRSSLLSQGTPQYAHPATQNPRTSLFSQGTPQSTSQQQIKDGGDYVYIHGYSPLIATQSDTAPATPTRSFKGSFMFDFIWHIIDI
jgi:hypothetical protein